MVDATQAKYGNVIYLNPSVPQETALRILKALKSEADAMLKHQFAGLLQNISESALAEMDRSSELRAVENYPRIVDSLNTNHHIFLEAFFKHMNQAWLNLLHKKDEPVVVDVDGEVAIEIERMQRKISIHYKILLRDLAARFNTIAGREMLYHPLLPNHIYHCYWSATGRLNLSDRERHLMLMAFNRFVMDKAGKLLGLINGKLEEMNIEPLQVKRDTTVFD